MPIKEVIPIYYNMQSKIQFAKMSERKWNTALHWYWQWQLGGGQWQWTKTKIETINFKKGPQVFPKGDILGPEILHDEASSCIDF